MKARTGLKTVAGKTRHTPQVLLFWEDCQRVLEWLPKGGDLPEDLGAELRRCMEEAKRDSDKFNQRIEEEAKTGRRSFEV